MLRHAQKRVAVLVDEVIRSTSVAQLVAETRALQDKLITHRSALRFLLVEKLVNEGERQAVSEVVHDRVWSVIGEYLHTNDGAPAWKAAREALARDANAELPA